MAGYALARTKSKVGNAMFLLFLAGLIVPFQMNIVSNGVINSFHTFRATMMTTVEMTGFNRGRTI